MLGEILRFLLEIVFTLFGAALIARAWMHAIRLPPFNPLARAIYQATNWLVLPLRKIIPAGNKIDWTSLVATWLSALVYLVLIWLVAIGALIPAALLPAAMGSALIMAIKWALNLIVWLTLIQAVLSWVNPMAPLMPLLSTLTAPLLDPIRRILPRSSIDFSPLVLLVVAQIVLMVLARLSYSLMGCSHEALRAFPRGAAADRRSRIRAARLGRQCCLGRCVLKRDDGVEAMWIASVPAARRPHQAAHINRSPTS